LATLYTLWQLTRNNEFMAMRTSGISLFRIMMPFLGVGVVFTLTTGLIKESVAPAAARWAKRYSNGKFEGAAESAYRQVAHFNVITRRQWLVDWPNVSASKDGTAKLWTVKTGEPRSREVMLPASSTPVR
jgi:hypothetical protein